MDSFTKRFEDQLAETCSRLDHHGVDGKETAKRIYRRLRSMDLEDLAATLVGSDTGKTVESVRDPRKQVDLLERVLEENDLIAARFLHRGSELARSVGRIVVREIGGTSFGTGFLISPALVMTNHHVLPGPQAAEQATFQLDYYERRDLEIGPTVTLHFDPNRFFVADRALDFAIVALADPNGAASDRTSIRLISESGKALVGEPVNIIQHPRGRPQKIAIKNNEIVGHSGSFLHYKTDTEPGSSGSPVMNMQWELAALHHSGVPKRDATGRYLLTNGQRWDGSDDTIDQIAWESNEGVRISRIVEFMLAFVRREPDLEELFMGALSEAHPNTSANPARPSRDAVVLGSRPPASAQFMFSDAELDQLADSEIARLKYESEPRTLELFERRRRSHRELGETLVAEGDSWFSYSIAGMDIIDCLKSFFGYRIYNVAEPGDTLDNMAWGTEFTRNWRRRSPPIEETKEAIADFAPRVALLSGGGNDIAGEDLLALLNHKDSGLSTIREDYAEFLIDDYFARAYQSIIGDLRSVSPQLHVIIHGYGHPIPDGRGVSALGFDFAGPWLRPHLTAKGYTDANERRGIIQQLIDRFNAMLSRLAADDPRLHYIDLRPIINYSDWENELHLHRSGFRRVAAEFDRRIRLINATP